MAVRKRTFGHGGHGIFTTSGLGAGRWIFYSDHDEAERESWHDVSLSDRARSRHQRLLQATFGAAGEMAAGVSLKLDDVRPLAAGASRDIAAAMGWSLPYTLGVLGSWKLAGFYCRAILAHDQRITLDGAPAETVDTEAKDLATKRLAELTARKAPKNPRRAKACRDDRRAGTKGSRDCSRARPAEAAGEA